MFLVPCSSFRVAAGPLLDPCSPLRTTHEPPASSVAMQPLSLEILDSVLAAPTALVYKHSTRCPISSMAHDEVCALMERRPEVPVWIVDVVAQRPVSRAIAERLGVTHHSPQLILVVNGEVAWDVSHFGIRAGELAQRLAVAEAG